MDIARAYHEVENTKNALRQCRTNVVSFHGRIYNRALAMARSVGVEEFAPRLATRQQHRSNIPGENCSEYFRLNLAITLLDHLISEFDTRFDRKSCDSITGFMLLLPSCIDNTSSSNTLDTLLSFN